MSRPRLRPSILLAFAAALALAGGACSLTVDLNGYSGGGGEDGGPDADAPVADGDDETLVDSTPADDADSTTGDVATDADAADATTADTADAADATDGDALDAADASDATDAADAADAADALDATDSADASDAADSLDAADSIADAADANPCATASHVGLSEIMVRAVSGTGDTHEWYELQNFDPSCTYDVGGLRTRTLSWSTSTGGFIEKSTYTLPAGVSLPPGGTLVFADVRATFLADASTYVTMNGIDTSLIYDLNKTLGDVFVNGYDNIVEVYPPGATLPSESVTIKARGTTWPGLGRSYAYPSACESNPLTPRLTGTSPVTTSTYWIDTPAVSTYQYGSYTPPDAGVQPFYGTPGKPNAIATSCP